MAGPLLPKRASLDISAMLLGRCPRCRRGHIFQPGLLGLLGAMRDRCEVCQLAFLRESGYFLGAMYVSYGLGVLTILPVTLLLIEALHWGLLPVMLVMVVQTLISMPLFLRYSRAIWLHVDQLVDPR